MNERPAPLASTGAIRLLLVEDNLDALDSLRMLLELDGTHVTACPDARAALDAIDGGCRPQIALIDIGLPDMRGDELARRLKRDGGIPGCHFVAITGDDDMPLDRSVFADRIVKPLDIQNVLAVVARHLGRPAR